MTKKHEKLLRKWATGHASRSEIMECMALDRKANHNDFTHDSQRDANRCPECRTTRTANRATRAEDDVDMPFSGSMERKT